ncbi:hypothetical protein PULV_a1375 [Pseudoalteromonas ulvae UL12]|nr:hypothetical protein [Pseudoalteromonas ulvae UL12]
MVLIDKNTQFLGVNQQAKTNRGEQTLVEQFSWSAQYSPDVITRRTNKHCL